MPGNSTLFPLEKVEEGERCWSTPKRRAEMLSASKLDVPVTTLSHVLNTHRIVPGASHRIALLKIDVEGSEVDVLNGISAEHWPMIDQVVAEAHGADRRAAVKELLAAHFEVVGDVEDAELRMSGLERAMVYARKPRATQQQANELAQQQANELIGNEFFGG